jgi:polysaccharide biosynthesis transport protein
MQSNLPAIMTPTSSPPELNFKEFIDVLRRRKSVFAQVFIMVVVVGMVATALTRPVFETQAKLLVPTGSSSVNVIDSNNPIATMLAAAQPDSVATQMQVLQSAPFLDDVRHAAGITAKPGVRPPSARVESLEGTNVIEITVEGGDPAEIERFANKMVDLHLEQTDLLRTTGLRETLKFVRREKSQSEKALAEAERKLLSFRQAHQMIDLSTEREARAGEYTALAARVLELESSLTTLRSTATALRARLANEPEEQYKETTRENERFGKLQAKLDELKLQETDLLREYLPNSRPVRDMERQIAGLQQQLASEPREIRVPLHSPNPNRPLLQSRLDEVQASLEGAEKDYRSAVAKLRAQKAQLDSLGPWEAQLNRLTRDRDSAQSTCASMTDRLRDLEIRAGARLRTARVIERAAVPTTPVRPRKSTSLALSAVLALLLATATVFLQEYLDDRVNAPEELEKISGLPTLAHVPAIVAGQPRLMAALPTDSPIAEAYRALRSSIGFAGMDAPIRRLQLTSALKGEGKSTTSVNLATAMARDGKKVILLDADMRSPSVHRLLEVPGSPGLSEVLAGMRTVDEALQATQIENLLIVPAGPVPPNPAELLGSRAFDQLLEQLDTQADIVIVDSPPCVPVTDPVIVAARMDGVVLLVHMGQTRRGAVRQAIELLGRARARLLGVLFNQVQQSGSNYYYYHSYGYGADSSEETRRPNARHRRNGQGRHPEPSNGKPLAVAGRGSHDHAEEDA